MAVDVFARTLALASLGNGGGGSAVDTYTKAEINKMIGDLETIQVELVDQLPTFEDAQNNVIYLVPVEGKSYHEEWMAFKSDEPESSGFWEQIGTTEIDMSQYSTTEELQEMMVQELAKYITSADFVEALKDYATKDYAENLIIGNKHIVTFTNTNKYYYAMTDSDNVDFFNFVKDILNPAADKYGPENIIVVLSSMISPDRHETLGLYLWDESSQVYSQPCENLSISEVSDKDHHWAIKNWYNFSLDISSGRKALSNPVQPPYIEFFDLDYDYQKPYMPKFDGSPATKKYVDDSITNIDIPEVDLTNYYTKEEIDEELQTTILGLPIIDVPTDENELPQFITENVIAKGLADGWDSFYLKFNGIGTPESDYYKGYYKFEELYDINEENEFKILYFNKISGPEFEPVSRSEAGVTDIGPMDMTITLYLNEDNVLKNYGMYHTTNPEDHYISVLQTDYDYAVPYEPQYNGSPATKKYVDDSVANAGDDTEFILKLSWATGGSNVDMTDTENLSAASEFVNKLYNYMADGEKGYSIKVLNETACSEINAALWNTDTEFNTQTTSYVLNGIYFRSLYASMPLSWSLAQNSITITGTWTDNVFTATNINYKVDLNKMFDPGDYSKKSDVLTKTNTTSFTPTADYHPATKKYVDDAITTAVGNIASFSLMPVTALPTENIQTNVIYLLPSENPEEENVRVEYVYINSAWEKIGTTEIDLSNYYTKTEFADSIIDGGTF